MVHWIKVGLQYIKFVILCQISHIVATTNGVTDGFPVNNYSVWIYVSRCNDHGADANTGVPCFLTREKLPPWKLTVATLCVLLMHDLLAITQFLVSLVFDSAVYLTNQCSKCLVELTIYFFIVTIMKSSTSNMFEECLQWLQKMIVQNLTMVDGECVYGSGWCTAWLWHCQLGRKKRVRPSFSIAVGLHYE